MNKTILASLLAIGCLITTPAVATIFDDFETINTNTGDPFTIGSAPESATFTGDAFSGVAGINELYNSGLRAWMVNPGGTGTISFDANASFVEFYARIRTGANGSSVFTAYDDADQLISSHEISFSSAFEKLTFTGNIDRIVVVNNATGPQEMNGIDDITFTAIPEPASFVLLGLGLSGLAMRRKLA